MKEDDIPNHRSKKDRKKWCKGKVGVDHQLECCDSRFFPDFNWKELRCKICGKIIDRWMPLKLTRGDGSKYFCNEKPPSWVTGIKRNDI